MKNLNDQVRKQIVDNIIKSIEINSKNTDALVKFLSDNKTDADIEKAIKYLAESSRVFAANAHLLKMDYDWNIHPTPEWFDHFIDQFFQTNKGLSFWMERGVYNVAAVKSGGTLLEICCGDGYNAKNFYSPLVKSMISLDFDPAAIEHAKRYNQAPNIDFQCKDIRSELPAGKFDNIIWDAAIEHFNEDEISSIMKNIKLRMNKESILSGYTIVEKEDGQKHLHQHEREFRSKEDLVGFPTPHFANVRVFETIHPTRHNLYFYASDEVVPFDKDWRFGMTVQTAGAGAP